MSWEKLKQITWRRICHGARAPLAAIVGAGLLVLAHVGTLRAAALLQEEPSTAARVWPALLAIFAAAFVIERVIEIIWNFLEWLLLNFGHWTPARLKSAQYMQFKSGTSLLIAAVLGILTANVTSMRLFAQLEPLAPSLLGAIPDTWDVLVTGLLIGATTKPVHDLIGMLTHFKEYLANNAVKQREMAGAALADGVLKLAESEAQSMIDVPGIGPTRLGVPDADSDANDGQEDSQTDAYIETLHNKTSL